MIRMPVLDLSQHTLKEQQNNLIKESDELYQAIQSENTDDICLKCLDLTQTALGILYIAEQDNFYRIRNLLRHELKLKCKEARGEVKIKGWINMECKDE